MGIPFDPGRFNALLGQMGQQVWWRKSYLCPCRNPVSGAAALNCPSCGGKGVTWASPVRSWTGLAGMKIAREWAQFGEWESGDVVFTIPSDSPLWAIGETDRVVMANSSEPFSIVLTRTGTEQSVTAGPIISVDRVFWLDPVTKAQIDGIPPVPARDGSLVYQAASAPPMGAQYSLTGRRQPEYFAFKDLPQDRAHFSGMPLPRRIQMRRFDLFGRG